ncbi:MAG: hypothetical protein PS018_20345 [bacterium]|nr:hypothetical protein [bacterium]
MRRGRLYWRSIRLRERGLASRPLGANEYRDDLDYRDIDRGEIMDKHDGMALGWRMLINEHGFTPVMQARQRSTDINEVEKMLQRRHAYRQQELAEGRA